MFSVSSFSFTCNQTAFIIVYSSFFQLPQVEINGQEANGRRFRVENGDSLGEKEEVRLMSNKCL